MPIIYSKTEVIVKRLLRHIEFFHRIAFRANETLYVMLGSKQWRTL
jgi:hypothetical protein